MSIQLHTVRLPAYIAIQRGFDTPLSAPVYLSGALVEPTSATMGLYEPGGSLVASYTAVIAGSVATVTVPAAASADTSISEGWRCEWSLVLPGLTLRARTDAAVVRRLLYPVVTDADIFRVQPQLSPTHDTPITREDDYQPYLDEAWQRVESRLIESGRRPWLIVSPGALRQVHLMGTLVLIFESLAMSAGSAMSDAADRYRAEYEAAWGRVVLAYDEDDDGTEDDKRGGQPSVLWLHGGLPYTARRW